MISWRRQDPNAVSGESPLPHPGFAGADDRLGSIGDLQLGEDVGDVDPARGGPPGRGVYTLFYGWRSHNRGRRVGVVAGEVQGPRGDPARVLGLRGLHGPAHAPGLAPGAHAGLRAARL